MKVFMAFVAGCILLHLSWSAVLHVLVFVGLFWLLSVRDRPNGEAADRVSMLLAALLSIAGRTLGRWG